MIDGIIKADGTSRLVRANLPETYEEFRAMAAAGTLPLDLLFNAAGWSQLPTFLNTANLLKAQTAALFGKDGSAVPDDILAWLGQYNQHWWRRTKNSFFAVARDGTELILQHASANGTRRLVSYADEITVDQTTGVITLVNPLELEVYYGTFETQQATLLLGKYVTNVVDGGTWYIDADATYEAYKPGSSIYQCKITSGAHLITAYPAGEWEYLRSASRDAYPDIGTVDGYTYQYLGIPSKNAVTAPKIAYGSYVGTGTAGANNKNSLSFDFVPKILFLSQSKDLRLNPEMGHNVGYAMLINGVTTAHVRQASTNGSDTILHIAWDDKNISWYHGYSTPYAGSQFNDTGETYFYLALGL